MHLGKSLQAIILAAGLTTSPSNAEIKLTEACKNDVPIYLTVIKYLEKKHDGNVPTIEIEINPSHVNDEDYVKCLSEGIFKMSFGQYMLEEIQKPAYRITKTVKRQVW